MSVRSAARAAALVAVATLAVLLAPAGSALAAAGIWDPTGSTYRNGVVCALPGRNAALVAWQSEPDSGGPAFATRTITAPADGGLGKVDTPATAPTTRTPVTAQTSGRTDADLAALAYLIGADGASSDPNTVGSVAALVAADPPAESCLAQGNPVDGATATALARQAAERAGPYRVTVSGNGSPVTLGTDSPVTAQVVSASGAPMSGLTVHFAADDPTATVANSQVTTDADGRAATTVRVPSTASSVPDAVTVRASVSAPVGVVQLDEPGDVPLWQADSPRSFAANARLPIDTTAAPVLHVQVGPALALPGATVHATVAVSGMHGHAGRAAVHALGPLPFQKVTGCSGYRGHWPGNAHSSDLAANVQVVGDGGFPLSIGPIHDPGCYVVLAQVQTSNARPQATAQSSADESAAVLAVPPLTVGAAPTGHAVAVPGPLTANLSVTGDVPATVTGTTGTLLGPRPASKGRCPTSGWDAARDAGLVSVGAHDDAPATGITSTAVTSDGCYSFRVSTTVQLPGIGSLDAPAVTSAPVLVVRPQLAVTGLSSSVLHPGEPVSARVAVYGTLTQPGTLRLQLARLPDTDGCFGRDYRSASVAALPADAPSTRTTGDADYTIRSPAVPTDGCWTAEPVLTLDNVPAARVVGVPQLGSNVAFSAVPRPAAFDDGGPVTPVDPTTRRIVAAVIAAVLLLVALGSAVVLARRSAEDEADPTAGDDIGPADLAAGAPSPR